MKKDCKNCEYFRETTYHGCTYCILTYTEKYDTNSCKNFKPREEDPDNDSK